MVKKSVSSSKVKKKLSVTIYSTKTCPYCQMAKEFLRDNKIKYKEIDLSEDIKAAQEMVKKSGQMGVPVIEINGHIIVGYDKEALKRILKL